jgi:hypothetical protein
MRDSGCNVPEYMLSMKKHSKKERRKKEREAPKRDSICTIPKFKKQYLRKSRYLFFVTILFFQIYFQINNIYIFLF